MSEKELKKKIKSSKLKQAGMATALIATVVPTVAAAVVADEDGFKKSNNSISYADAKLNSVGQTTTTASSISYSTSSIPVPKGDPSGRGNDWQMLQLDAPDLRAKGTWAENETILLSHFVNSYITPNEKDEGIFENLKKIELGQAQGSSKYFTLNLSSGLQFPNMTDAFMNNLANVYNTLRKTQVDKQQLKSAFKAYYLIEGDTEWKLLADANGNQASGTNSFSIGDLSKFMVNNQLPNIHVGWFFNFDPAILSKNHESVSSIPKELKDSLQGHGGTWTIEGGARPNSLFKTMTDFSTFYSDSSIPLPSFTSGLTPKEDTTINNYLKTKLENIVQGANYSGTTAKTLVSFSTPFDPTNDKTITDFFGSTMNQYTNKNMGTSSQIYPSLYYSIGEEAALHKIPNGMTSFTITNWNQNTVKTANDGPYLNDIHYYIAYDQADSGAKSIWGWDSLKNQSTTFRTVGVRKDITSYDKTTKLTKTQFKGIKDFVSSFDVPKPVDDTKPERTVIESESHDLVDIVETTDPSGTVKHQGKINVIFKYRLAGTTTWYSKNDFFGAGKPGSTPEALNGTEWIATTSASWDDDLTKKPPVGAIWDKNQNGFVGTVGWDLPLISQIDAPTFSVKDSTNYSITIPSNSAGILYKFRLVNPENPTETLPWPNKTSGEYVTFQEFKKIPVTSLPNIFNQANGKFYAIEWVGNALNKSSPKLEEKGTYHLTNDDLPKTTLHAVVKDGDNTTVDNPINANAFPTINATKTTNTNNINITLPKNNVFNFIFGFDKNSMNLHLDQDGFLVSSNGSKVNTLVGKVSKPIIWSLGNPPVFANSNVDFTSKYATPEGTIATSGITRYIDKIDNMPLLTSNSNTSYFDIKEFSGTGDSFPYEWQYSVDNVNFLKLSDFLKISTSGDELLHTDVAGFANNIRSLLVNGKNIPIYIRTAPVDGTHNYTIDPIVASGRSLTYNATYKSWYGKIDTSALKQVVSTDAFWSNIPTLTGTTTQDFDVNVPTIPNVQFKFKFANEGDGAYKDWATFKTDVNGNWTDVTGATAQIKKIVWKAFVSDDTKLVFANTSNKMTTKHYVDSSGVFQAQDLGNTSLTAKVPLTVTAPSFDGNDTSIMRLRGFDQTGMTYEYSVDGQTYHKFEEFNNSQKLRDEVINSDGKTLRDISWRVRFDDPFVPATGATTTGTFSTSNVKILISTITPLGPNIFAGSNSYDWKLDTSKITQIGIKYKIVINGKEYDINDPVLQNANTINLFDDRTNNFYAISWKAEADNGFTFGGKQLTDHGSITPALKKFIQHISFPTITGVMSDVFTVEENTNNNVEFTYMSDTVTSWVDAAAFKTQQKNIYNTATNAFDNVKFKVKPISTDYIISDSIQGLTNGEGIVNVFVKNKVIGVTPTPSASGTTSVNYTLDDTVTANHVIYRYWVDDADAATGFTFAEFKAKYPNIYDQNAGRLLTIHYSAKPEQGYNFPDQSNGTLSLGLSGLTKIIETAKLPTLSVDATSGTTTNFTPKTSIAIPAGVEYTYSTSQTGTFLPLSAFLHNEHNLYDSATGKLKTVYYKAATTNAIDYAFDVQPIAAQLNIDALSKVVDTFVAPKMEATNNMSNAYWVTEQNPATPNVTISYWTTASTNTNKVTTFDKTKLGLPTNIFRGKDSMPTVKWEATLPSGYVWATGSNPAGDFTQQADAFTKVYNTDTFIPAPILNAPSPTNWKTITEQTPPGLEYKYYLEGEDASKAESLQAFYLDHSNIYDSVNKKYKVIHFVVSVAAPTAGDTHTYSIDTKSVHVDRPITVTNQRTVITNVVLPNFDNATINSHDFTINEHDASQVKTTYSIDGTNVVGLSLAELRKWIKDNHNDNLWDQATDTFLKIKWELTPTDTTTDLDPATTTSGHLDYAPMITANKMDKYLLPPTPVFSGTSTKSQDTTLASLDTTHFSYKFSRTGTGQGNDGKWVSLAGVYSNFYDAKTGNMRSFHWKATPLPGFATSTTNATGVITPATTMVKYIDVINEPSLTGTATDAYTITETATNGVSILYSTNNADLNSFVPLSAFEADAANDNIANKTVYYLVKQNGTDYKLDPKFNQPIAFSTVLNKALDDFVKPSFNSNSKSNAWTILTPDTNVDYQFQVTSLNTGWVSAQDLLTKVGDKLFDSKENTMLTVEYKVKAKTGNVFSSKYISNWQGKKTGADVNLELYGEVSTAAVAKVVTTVEAPTLSWASNASKNSDNYTVKTGGTKSVDYQISIGDTAHYEPLSTFTKKNLYDSASGNKLKIYWKAIPKINNEKAQPWSFDNVEISESDIQKWIIDSVEVSTLEGKAGAVADTTSYNFTTPTANVDYYFVDAHDATLKMETLTDFLANQDHANIFDSTSFSVHDIGFVVAPKSPEFEFAPSITNTKDNGATTATPIALLSTITKVIDADLTPSLSGNTKQWDIYTKPVFVPGVVYSYRIANSSESYSDLKVVKKAHQNLDYQGVIHDVEWQATETSGYKFATTVVNTHGILKNNLTSDLEIKNISAPVITFTDTHQYNLDSTSLSSNVVYKFGLDGEDKGTFELFDDFKTGHANLFDAAGNTLKNIAWVATPSTSDTYHFNTSDATDGVIDIQKEKRYIEALPAPTLVKADALSTNIDITEPTPYSSYVTYKYQIDNKGTWYTKDELIAAYAALTWDGTLGKINYEATANNTNTVKYFIGSFAGSKEIDTTKIIKVVDPAPVVLGTPSTTTSSYWLDTATQTGLNYSVSIDGWKNDSSLDQFDNTQALYTLDGGLVTVEWKVEAATGYVIKNGAKVNGTVNLSSLKLIVDKVPAPVLGGNDTTDYTLTVDPKTTSLFDYKYSFDPQADPTTFVPLADLKTSADGQNIYNLSAEENRTIYYLPFAKGNVGFETNPTVQSIDTSSLKSIISAVTEPTLTAASVRSDTYDITASQNGVDFTFSTDQNDASSYVPLATFLSTHQNIYNNSTWTLPNIYWKASVSTTNVHTGQVFAFASGVKTSGTIDTQGLKKVIDQMPMIGASGTTLDFSETTYNDPNQALLNIPGLTFSFVHNNVHYNTLQELIAGENAKKAGFNAWNVKNNQMEVITYEVPNTDPNYIVKNSSDKSGNVNLDKLVKVIDFIDESSWVPKVKSGSNYDSYDFLITSLPTHLEKLFDFKYATDENAPESDWKNLADFKSSYPTLMKNAGDPAASDHSIMRVFYKIELKDSTHYNFIQPDLKGVKEEIPLGIKNVIFNIPAPIVSTSNLHNGVGGTVGTTHPTSKTFELEYPDPNIQYMFQISGNGQWLTFEQLLKTSKFNTYDSTQNAFKDLAFQASPKPGYQFSTGQSTFQGSVDMENSGVSKIIEQVVVPVLAGADSLNYSFVLPQGKTEFTKGLDYLMKIEGETRELTPAEWVHIGKNLFDVAHNKNLRVSYVLKTQNGYSVNDPNATGDLTLPANMVNIIDTVTAPLFKATTNNLTTEDWELSEVGANGFEFKYSIDNGTTYLSKAELTNVLKPLFNNLYNNNSEVMKSILWKAVVTDATKYSISATSSGSVDIPSNIIRAIDDVEKPTIPDKSFSDNYTFTEPTKNVNYLYKLANEPDDSTHWKNQADFISSHPNLYDMDAQQLRVVSFKAIAKQGYVLTANAKTQGGNLDMGRISTYVLSEVPAVSVEPNGTTRLYQFKPDKSKTGIEYEYGVNENGPFESQSSFITNHRNLFDADNGLTKVYWHAKTTSSTFKFGYGLTLVGEIDLSSLTKIVDKDANIPTFKQSSDTMNWEFEPLDQQGAWIDHYELKMDNDSVGWRTIGDFKSVYPNLTTYRDNGTKVYWRAVVNAPEYAWGTNNRRDGLVDLSVLQRKYTTKDYDLSKLTFAVTNDNKYTPQYDGQDGLPTIDYAKGFHLEYAWADQPNKWIEDGNSAWAFHQTLAASELWDNDHVNADGTAGVWKHGGKITFRFAPNSLTSGIDSDQATTIDFDDLVAQKQIVKIISNPSITVNSEPHIQGNDIHLGFLPKYTTLWDEKTNLVNSPLGPKEGSDSLLPILGLWYEKPINNYQIVISPFEQMTKSEIDLLINSMTSERLSEIQSKYPQYIPNTVGLDQIKNTFKKIWLTQSEAIQFFLMADDIWTGYEWKINSVVAKSLANPDFKVIQEVTRVVWSHQENTIAKVTDNSLIIRDLEDAIKPADQVGSLHDSVIWGDKSKIQPIIDRANLQRLVIKFATELDANGDPIWHTMSNLDDPNDFYNIVTKIDQDHEKRMLLLQVLSSDIDDATGQNVKVSNDGTIDITQQSGIKRVKTRITATGKYSTTNIQVSGFTDTETKIDESVVTESYLQVTYQIKQVPGVWMTKDQLIAKIDELRKNGTTVFGEDITANIGLKDSLNDKYSLGTKIEGAVDFSQLHTHKDISEYVEALKNDVKLIGAPLDAAHQTSQDKTMYITFDNSVITSSDFTNFYGIQYRVNDSTTWNLFDPVKTPLDEDIKNNIISSHAAGTYMKVRAVVGDKFYFRVVPIATANGNVVITPKDANHTQAEIYTLTRVLSSDWNGSPASEGTVIERDTNSLLLSGEHQLIEFIDDNLKSTQSYLMNNQRADETWIHSFLTLVTSRPRFEIVQDAKFDPKLIGAKEIKEILNDGDQIARLVEKGILSTTEQDIIKTTIENSTPRRVNGKPVAWEKAFVDKNGNPYWVMDPKDPTKPLDPKVPDLSFKEDEDHIKKFINLAPLPSLAFVSDFMIKNPEILKKLYTYDDTERESHDFNKDLIQAGESSFEITQIGSGVSNDEWGLGFTHSNTIFFGTNAIRFNISENYIDQTNHITDAYFIGEDSKVKENTTTIHGERIAKIHVSTQYSLETMSLVLELVNGQTVYLEKSFDGSSQDKVVRYVRINPRYDANNKILDINNNGGDWAYASESLIEKNVEHVSVAEEAFPTNEDLLMEKNTLKKTIRHWVASPDELKEHSDKNELPYAIEWFDNSDSDKNAIVLAATEEQENEIRLGLATAPGSIYRNEVGNVIEWFSANHPSQGSSTAATAPVATTFNNTSHVTFDTVSHFADETKYINQRVFEQTLQDHTTNEWKGYMVIKSDADKQGNVYLRAIEQSTKSVEVNDLSYNPSLLSNKHAKSFPTWAIILASAGTAGILGAAYGGYLWYNKHIAKKAARLRRRSLSIKFRKK